MAKKKYTKKPVKRKKGKRKNKKELTLLSLITSLKNMTVGAAVVAVAFIGLLFFIEYWYAPVQQDATNVLNYPEKAELPRLLSGKKEQVVFYEGFTVSYNSDYKISNWVAWELTKEEAESREVERANKFTPDPTLKGATALNEDYTRTGYDRGHIAPAGDMKWSSKAMRESFYFSNICPQVPGLNRGLWKTLEEQCRVWAIEHGSVMIVAGPVIEDDLKRLGKNRVAIPRQFYKVVSTISDNKYTGIAFLMENKDYKKTPLKATAVPIDSIQKLTGIDFFHTLPDDLERAMEVSIDWKSWSF